MEQQPRTRKLIGIDPEDRRLIPLMREAVTERVESTSLRGAALEVGMSPSGLQKFLEGGMPYAKTIRRLRSWYLQYAAGAGPELSHEEAFAALSVLVHDLAPSARATTVESVLGCMEEGYARSGRKIRPWVAAARNHFVTPE